MKKLRRLTEVKKPQVNPKDSRFKLRDRPTCPSCATEMVRKGQIFVCYNCGDNSAHS